MYRKCTKNSFVRIFASSEDCKDICENYIVLVARVLTENFKHFSGLRDCVPKHNPHIYSHEMKQKMKMVRQIIIFMMVKLL